MATGVKIFAVVHDVLRVQRAWTTFIALRQIETGLWAPIRPTFDLIKFLGINFVVYLEGVCAFVVLVKSLIFFFYLLFYQRDFLLSFIHALLYQDVLDADLASEAPHFLDIF